MLPARPKQRIGSLAIDFDPLTVQSEAIALNPARNCLTKIGEAWTRLMDAEKASTDKKRLSKAVASVVAFVDKMAVESLKSMQSFRDDAEARIAVELRHGLDQASVAGEIRAFYRCAKHPFSLLGTAITAGDRRSVAAVLDGPCFLSGMDASQHAVLRDLARKQWCAVDDKIVSDVDKHGQQIIKLQAHVHTVLAPLVKEWSGEKEEAAFANLGNGGVA
jgi:hypothetical protein